MPGDQKLAPLSSADDERWPRKAEKAIAEITASNRGERLRETIPPSLSHPQHADYCGPSLQIYKATNMLIACRLKAERFGALADFSELQ